jgi:membrane protease YdiL (CAAX protease family)
MKNQLPVFLIFAIWLAAVIPFSLLVAAAVPALVRATGASAILLYWILLPMNAAWLSGLSLWTIRREEGNLRWKTIRRRIWLDPPHEKPAGMANTRFGFRMAFGIFAAFLALILGLALPSIVPAAIYILPYSSFTNLTEAGSPEFAGNGGWFVLVAVAWMANMLIAEELLFRGVLLPKMKGAFGRMDGIINGLFYGLYYLAAPLQIPFRWITGSAAALLAGRFQDNRRALTIRCLEGIAVMGFALAGVTSLRFAPLTAMPSLPWLENGPTAGEPMNITKLASLPAYIPGSQYPFQVDLRDKDLSGLDLRSSENDLSYACFNSRTVWPPAERMPSGFDPAAIMEWVKNPGLGLRELHDRGITGRGIGIAIIDQGLLTGHREYAGRLMWYEEITRNPVGLLTAFHASSVASIAVGKTAGVAPEGDLYFISSNDVILRGAVWYMHYDAIGIRRVIEVNRFLPADRKIRVISISIGSAPPGMAGSADFLSAVREAEQEGMYTIFTNRTGSGYVGLAGRSLLSDPDDFRSYDQSILSQIQYMDRPDSLLIPVDSLTLAGASREDEYYFCRIGGLSWMMPFSAGLFALSLQVDPDLTLDQFWELAFQTAEPLEVFHDGTMYKIGKLVDPQALIAELPLGEK